MRIENIVIKNKSHAIGWLVGRRRKKTTIYFDNRNEFEAATARECLVHFEIKQTTNQ